MAKLTKRAQQIREKVDANRTYSLDEAVALLSDQMQVTGENRALLRRGLALIRRAPRPGLAALLDSARLRPETVDETDILYQVAPRINAAGRVGSARQGVEVLLAEDSRQARPLAAQLDQWNRRRREIDAQVTQEALVQAGEALRQGDPAGLVLASPEWHLGVVGIAATRVVEAFDRPAVLLAVEGDEARGSGRSTRGVDLKAALDHCAEHLLRHGGHAAAAGMTLRAGRIDGFAEAFAEACRRAPQEEQGALLALDACLPLGAIDAGLAGFLERFGPFGPGHRAPLFAGLGLRPAHVRVLKEKHLKLRLHDGEGASFGFIGFGLAPEWRHHVEEGTRLDVAFRVRYRPGTGYDPWELTIQDLRSPREEVSP